jgi:serine/threonine protein kinase
VLELGVMPDGTPIIVMEHLEGRSLDLILAARGPMPLAEVLPIVRGIATGLHAAHEVNVIHREVRPDNVFIAKVAGYEQGFVKLLDFGVSRLLPPGPAQGLNAAAARFLAPEQARGVGSEVDARTDQYSLAVLTYRMLAGADLFAGDEAISVLYHVLHDTPRPLTEVVRIDRDVEAVIRKGMSHEKQERFGSVIAFLRALEEAAAGQRPSPQLAVAARGGKPSRSSWFSRRARTEEVPEPAAAAEDEPKESEPEVREAREVREEAQVSSERSSGEYRVASRGDERSSISRQSRALTLRDTLSERFFAEGERKEEEGDWSPSDLDDERPDGLDDVDSFDSIPRRRWPMMVGLAAVVALVPLGGWLWPEWRTLFSGRPTTFWSDPSKPNGTVLPTTVPDQPSASATVAVPIPGAGTPSVPSPGTSVPPSAPAPAPHAVPSPGTTMPATTAPAALPSRPALPSKVAQTPPSAAVPPSNVAQTPPSPGTSVPPSQPVAVPSQPVAVPSQPVAVPSQPVAVPSQPVAVPSQPAAQPMVVPAVPVAPAQPAAVPTQPSSVGAWAPRAAAPAAAAPTPPPAATTTPRGEGNVPLRGYVWSPKEHRLVPAN